jgi:hypothetical protein
LLSLYWAAGGTLGLNQLGASLQKEASTLDTSFVILVALTGAAKLLGALVPLGLAFAWGGHRSRRTLAILTWAGGALLTQYGVGDIVGATVGAIRDTTEYAIWYATLWGPVWLLGGLLFLLTAWTSRSER